MSTGSKTEPLTWNTGREKQDIVIEDLVLAAIFLLIAMFLLGIINLEYLSQIHPPH